MFCGIVEELGVVDSLDVGDGITRIAVAAHKTMADLAVGDSVALNGVCLTAVEVGPHRFVVEAMHETLERTTLGGLGEGDPVDLERAVRAADRIDGHIVQGHVDGVGTVLSRRAEGDAERVRIGVDDGLDRYIVEKGSIAVDGVSLTVTGVSPPGTRPAWFEVALIPHTLTVTVLGAGRPIGSTVNLETDVLAKYVERLMETRS